MRPPWIDGDGALNQRHCVGMLSRLQREQSQQMQRRRMLRGLRQNLPRDAVGLRGTPRHAVLLCQRQCLIICHLFLRPKLLSKRLLPRQHEAMSKVTMVFSEAQASAIAKSEDLFLGEGLAHADA